ncbi:hypothetical protein [Hydrogenophaga laconesensis]|uniref:Uncharacterized protein n=1 Tax=Hydrogenophaga laconesensis TaxID=1805971 RepID=A0ABU1V5J6_9BURK|nr:hypothetical protein [Hydrogenophaga laconesensis]MDR7092662.1 hypothetical protein [Hydrogenophaga laconesensis]
MKTSRLLTSSVAALTVVGAGFVFAQATPGTTTEPAPGQQPAQAQPMPPATTTTPTQDTAQRSTVPMAPDAQADRN